MAVHVRAVFADREQQRQLPVADRGVDGVLSPRAGVVSSASVRLGHFRATTRPDIVRGVTR
jgi:hypothetical protein